jgi:hypothetical protein
LKRKIPRGASFNWRTANGLPDPADGAPVRRQKCFETNCARRRTGIDSLEKMNFMSKKRTRYPEGIAPTFGQAAA